VNDLERDLREVLHEDARSVPTPISAPEGLRRSVRRRQAVFGGLVGLSALAIVAAVVTGPTMLLPPKSNRPAGVGPMKTGTLSGVKITYPAGWHLIDPDEAGLNGPGPSTLPRIVLALAPTDPDDAFGCPGMLEGVSPNLLMTVQEEPLALSGPAAAAGWPASLEPLDVDASEFSCYPGWTFQRAGWTASGRTFEARIGIAPDAGAGDRQALASAFASMTFAPADQAPTSVVLTTGTAGGEDWDLTAAHQLDGLSLTLNAESFGTGSGGYDPTSDELRLTSHVFGDGAAAERVVFGAVPEAVVSVEASSAAASVVSADVLDVPNTIDPDLNAFALVVAPEGKIDLHGFDAAGNVVIGGTVGAPEPAPFPGASLEDGRHFGYVRSVDVDARTIEFDLAYFLSGEEANAAYQAAGGTGPVPNDHFVVNDNPKLRTLPLAPDVRLRLLDWNHCCETFFDGDLALFGQAIEEQGDVTDGDLIYRGQSQWWITVENGLVTEIEEQYSP
jgi:hypothetical protein